MSSSSATACSRSPSPDTPESAEVLDPALFESTLQSWCSTFDSGSEMWSKDPHEISSMLSKDDHQPLDFHDLIQEQMFDEYVLSRSQTDILSLIMCLVWSESILHPLMFRRPKAPLYLQQNLSSMLYKCLIYSPPIILPLSKPPNLHLRHPLFHGP